MTNTSDQQLRWSRKDEQVIAQATVYVDYESALPPEQQLKDVSLALMQEVLAEAVDARGAVAYNDAERIKAGTTCRTATKEIKGVLRQVRKVLDARYLDDVSPLADWGFEVLLSRGKPTLRMPRNNQGWRNLMRTCLAREQEQPEEERVVTPSFEDMMALQQKLQDSIKARQEALAGREAAVAARKAATRRLLALLKVAADTRVHVYYEGQISPELQSWGYNVVARPDGG